MTTAPVRYVASKALFSFLGSTFRLHRPDGSLAYLVKQKAFRLREKIDVFADEARSQLRLEIKARKISDMRGRYDIVDPASGEVVGGAKRNALRSILLDDWDLFDAAGEPIGKLKEKANALAFLRKFLKIIPQTYEVLVDGERRGEIRQRFHLFKLVYDVDLEDVDERLAVGATVLLLAIESGRD